MLLEEREESVRKKKEEKSELRLGQGEWRVERLQPMLLLRGFRPQPIPSNNQRAKLLDIIQKNPDKMAAKREQYFIVFSLFLVFQLHFFYLFYIPWPFPPVWGVADNTKETTKNMVFCVS